MGLNSEDLFFLNITGANHASFGAYNDSLRGPDTTGTNFDGPLEIDSEIVWKKSAPAIADVGVRTGESLPKKCKDRKIFGKKNGCEQTIGKGTKTNVQTKCNKKYRGKRIHEICVKTCGKVGLGKCK